MSASITVDVFPRGSFQHLLTNRNDLLSLFSPVSVHFATIPGPEETRALYVATKLYLLIPTSSDDIPASIWNKWHFLHFQKLSWMSFNL